MITILQVSDVQIYPSYSVAALLKSPKCKRGNDKRCNLRMGGVGGGGGVLSWYKLKLLEASFGQTQFLLRVNTKHSHPTQAVFYILIKNFYW